MDLITTFIVLFLIVSIIIVLLCDFFADYESRNKTTLKKERGSSFFDIFSRDKERKKAGREGEKINAKRIKSALNEDDVHLRGVEIDYNGRCECDNVIINKYGVYVIESKNYSGKLSGDINDFNLIETKYYDGNYIKKEVRNPINQSNRQSGILHRFLKDHGVDVWVEGYGMNANNDQYFSDRMLHTKKDIDRAIHTKSNHNPYELSKAKREKIIKLLK